MNIDTAVALVLGILIGGVSTGVFLGNLAHQHYEKYKAMKALAFEMEEKFLDALEGNTDRMWILKGEGAEDPYVVRGRPDIHKKDVEAALPPKESLSGDSDSVDVLDLTKVEEW